MLTLNDGRSELWQWDTGRALAVDADCSQVHFSNKVFGRSIDVDVVDGVAIIPDVLLQTDKELIAWAFAGTSENGYTKISKVFKVNRRNKPADYVFTPPEQTTLGEILERLDDLESIQDPDAIKNAVEDYLEQNPVEAPVKSVNGKTGEVELTSEDVGAISQDDLQEATNNALAQAKKSGEFDGEPGKDGAPGLDGQDYVLTEEDKAEIAELAAELVEIPEGSGGGIAVTGATVGQTVKIAAVDEEGVPTAWEPVDMPSGGEDTWELIADIKTTEEVSAITVDESYSLSSYKKLYIQLSGQITTAAQNYISANGVDSSLYVLARTPYSSNLYRSLNGYIYKSPSGGIAFVGGYKSSSTFDSINTGLFTNMHSISIFPITSLKCSLSAGAFAIGNVVKLWGVKE